MCTHPFLVGTFDVIGVYVNISSPMGLLCLFNTGSLARGCLVYLTDTDTGVTLLQSGLEIIGHTSQYFFMSLLQWSSVYRGVLSRGV